MEEDINTFIELVETRIFDLTLMLREHKLGLKAEFSMRDITSALETNKQMLRCLIATRDYGFGVRVYPREEPKAPTERVLLRTVFPIGHPCHGKDDLFGEIAIA